MSAFSAIGAAPRSRLRAASARGLAIPLGLAAVYLALLAVRFPQLIGWLNNDLDVGGAYVLATAVAHGHTGGYVLLGTQGAWASLGWAVLTFGLPDHRLIWELSPALASVACASVIGCTVGRLAGRGAGVLASALIVAASPALLWILTAPWLHNTTFLGIALLGAYLVWVHSGPHSALATTAATIAMSLVVGVFMASDELLEPAGFIPFLIAPVLLALRTGDRRGLVAVVTVAAGAALVAAATNAGMHDAGYGTTVPRVRLDVSLAPSHLAWLAEGFLRLGNGITAGGLDPARLPFTVGALVIDVGALAASGRVAARSLISPGTGPERVRALHVTFWASTIACSSIAYVLTGIATIPADRYVAVVVPAVAAIVPLRLSRPGRRLPVLVGASVFILASMVGLIGGDDAVNDNRVIGVQQADRVAALVARHHLGVGYAGYSDSGPLDWESHMRLQLHPVQQTADGRLIPATVAHVRAWYRPRLHAPSYLVISRDNEFLPDRVPSALPEPAHIYRVGGLRIASWPHDIAAELTDRNS